MFTDFTDKSVAADRQLHVEHGKPLIFGEDRRRGLRLRPGTIELEVVTIGEDGITEADILIHDETSRTMATLLAGLAPPNMPVALGVLLCAPAQSFDAAIHSDPEATVPLPDVQDLDALLRRGHTWKVDA